MIVITNPTQIINEIDTIHSLFENGLELLHIRKPDYSENEMKIFLSKIKTDYRLQLVLHSHHHLAEDLGINRIQMNPVRVLNSDRIIPEKNIFSTSTHSIAEFNLLSNNYKYAFLSPVFPSISKENYFPKINLFEEIKKRTNFNTQLIALSGIEAANIEKTFASGFDDVALLGTIWNAESPIKNFKLCQQIAHSF